MFKSKSEKEKLMTKALKSIGMALTVSSILVGCAKDLPEKEPDAVKENVFAKENVNNAKIIIETVQRENAIEGIQGIEAQGTSTGISAISSTNYYNVEIVSATNEALNPFLKDLMIEADGEGERFEISFKISNGFLVAYAKPLNEKSGTFAIQSKDLMPANAESMSQLPLFQYKVDAFGIKENVKNDLDEETRNIQFKATNKDVATHIQLSPIVTKRKMTGLLGMDEEERKSIFKKDRIENEVWTVARARKLIRDSKALIKSDLYDGYTFNSNDNLKIEVHGNSLTIKRVIEKSELTDLEKEIVYLTHSTKYVSQCDQSFAKAISVAKNNCFLRAEVFKAIDHINLKYDVDQEDGTILAQLKTEKTTNTASTNLIKIEPTGKISKVDISKVKLDADGIFNIKKLENKTFAILKTTTEKELKYFQRDGVESESSNLTAVKGIKVFNTEVTKTNDARLNDLLKKVDLVAEKPGEKFYVTFEVTQTAIVGYIKSFNGSKLVRSHLPQEIQDEDKVPAFDLQIAKHGVKTKVITKEDTKEVVYRLNETDRDEATHILPLSNDPISAGITDFKAVINQSIFKKDSLESEIYSHKRIKRLLNVKDKSLDQSEQNGFHKFTDKDAFKVTIFDSDLVVSRFINESDLNEEEKTILSKGNYNRYINKCSFKDQAQVDALNKTLGRSDSDKLEIDNCYLRGEYTASVTHINLKQHRDRVTNELLAQTVINYDGVDPKTSQLVMISENNVRDGVNYSLKEEKDTVWLKLSKFKNDEYMMRRVLEDSPNVYNYTFAGSAGGWNVKLVKFVFDADAVYVKNSRATLAKTRTTEVDEEIIMSFPVRYVREIKFNDDGEKLRVKRYEASDYLDDQAFAIVNLAANSAPRIDSAIDFFSGERCFAGQEPRSKEAIDIVQEADGMDDLLNYSIVSTYIAMPSRSMDCSGVYYSDQAHRTLTFKERVSFKKYTGKDENPPLAIPYEVQKKFNFGIFTGEKTVPKGYSEQTNNFDSSVSLPMVYDIRKGKNITYVLAGIPAANAKKGRTLKSAEKDLRNKLIKSSKKVVDDINVGFKRAFKGTDNENRKDIITLKIERDDSMPAGVKRFKGLEVVEKGHIGDINRNYIYWVEKGTSLSIIGLGGPHSNPRNGFVESASVYLYGGNMKGSIDWMVNQAKAEKKYLDSMNKARKFVYYKDQAKDEDQVSFINLSDEPAYTEDELEAIWEADAEKQRQLLYGDKDQKSSNIREEILASLDHNNHAHVALEYLQKQMNDTKDPLRVINDTLKLKISATQFNDAIDKVYDISKDGYGIKTPLKDLQIVELFKDEKNLEKTLKYLGAYNNFNDKVKLAQVLHGEDSREAQEAKILEKLHWTKRDGKSDIKNPICVHRKSEYVLSKLARSYDVVEKASTDFGKNDILIDIWMPTLAHEIGHNLGLRHNFIGSFDKKNWKFTSDDENATRASSSIMDYQTDDHITYDGLGPYDVYALRAAYTGYIELEQVTDTPVETMTKFGKTIKLRNVKHKTKEGVKYTQLAHISDMIDAIGKENVKNISRDEIKQFGTKKIKFCTDEDAGQSPQCNRHDAGTTFQEIVDNTIHDYRKLYDYIYFPGQRKDFYLGGPIQWLLGKFMKLRQLNEELWYQLIFERGNYTEEEWNARVTDMIGAVQTSMDFLRSVVATPEAPNYVSASNREERFIPAGIKYKKAVGPVEVEKKKAIMVETKWTEGRTFDSQDFRAMFRGTEYDKVAAIMALTADSSPSYRYYKHSLRIPYTLLEKFIFRRDSNQSLVLKTLQEVLLDDVKPLALVDLNLHNPSKAPEYQLAELDRKVFSSTVNEFIRNYAVFGAMYFLNIKTYEPTFNPSRAFRIEGKNEDDLKMINPENGQLEPYVQIVGGDQVFVPDANDSYMASELIVKGDILRPISELSEVFEKKAEIYPQIAQFLAGVPASQDFDQAKMDELTAALPELIAQGAQDDIINSYIELVPLYKNRLTNGTPEEVEKAKKFLEELTPDKFSNDVFKKLYSDRMLKIGVDPTKIPMELLEGGALQNVATRIQAAEACIQKRDNCPAAYKNTLQGIKGSRHTNLIRGFVKNDLNNWAVPTINAEGQLNLLELLFSSVLAHTKLQDKFGSPVFSAYQPDKSASNSHDRIKGNVTELSNIFFMLNPQENR